MNNLTDRQTDRQTSYDYLRAISCISVVILHISSMYLKDDFTGLISETDWMVASFWRVLTNLAVPSFVMLSGAFIIRSENARFKEFYSKMFKRILLPTIIFSVIYVFMHYAEIILSHIFSISVEADQTNIWLPVINMIYGRPHGTMWYMYMIIPLYFITPVIVMVKESLSVKWYRRLAVIMMIYGLIVEKSCSLSWILSFVCWLGYFMLGDVIRGWVKDYKNNTAIRHHQMIGVGMIALPYLMLTIHWYVLTYKTSQLTVTSSFSLIVIIATVMQFIGFSLISTKRTNGFIDIIAKYSLGIYLIHPIFVEVYMQLFGRVAEWFPISWLVPVYTIITIGGCIGIILFTKDYVWKLIIEKS